MQKKGLSDIVSTVLIILIVVVALAIIGVIIINVVNVSKIKLEMASTCQSVRATPLKCGVSGTVVTGTYKVEFPNDVSFDNLTLVLKKANGIPTKFYVSTTGIVNAQVLTFNELNTPGDSFTKFSVIPSIKDLNGKVFSCPSILEINCNPGEIITNVIGTPINSNMQINTPGVYTVTNDFSGGTSESPSGGIVINTDNVTINGNGKTISGFDRNDNGIQIDDSRKNITIYDLNVVGFDTGVHISGDGSANITLSDITLTSLNNGIDIDDAPTITLQNLVLSDLDGRGIYIHGSNSKYNVLSNIQINGVNGDSAIRIEDSSNNNLNNVNTSNNDNFGIYISGEDSKNNILTDINSNYNHGGDGIKIEDSSRNTLTNINANHNANYGIYLYGGVAVRNIFNNLNVSNNENGLCLEDSDYNEFYNLISISNNNFGMCLFGNADFNQVYNSILKNSDSGIYIDQSYSNVFQNSSTTSNSHGIQYVSGAAYNVYSGVSTGNNDDDISCADFNTNVDAGLTYNNNNNCEWVSLPVNGAVIPVTSCTILNQSGRTYSLMNDLTTNGDCLLIVNNSITLNGNNHTINGSYGGRGVHLQGTNNVLVKDLNINKFYDGLIISSSNDIIGRNNRIINVNSSFNARRGVYIFRTPYNVLSNVLVSNNNRSNNPSDVETIYTSTIIEDKGIKILGSSGNLLINVTAYKNDDSGINIDGSQFTDTHINDSVTYYESSPRNILININSSNNGYKGVSFTRDSSTSLLNKAFLNFNKKSGLNIHNSNENAIFSTIIFGNGAEGIRLKDTSDNKFSNVSSSSSVTSNLNCVPTIYDNFNWGNFDFGSTSYPANCPSWNN